MSAANIRKLQASKMDYARCAAAAALESSRHPGATAALEAALRDPYSGVRQVAIQSLARRARRNDEEAVAALVRTLVSASDVRSLAADGLGELWSDLYADIWQCTVDRGPAVEALAGLLDDADEATRVAAGNALGELHDPRAIPVLLEVARGEWGSTLAIRRIREVLERTASSVTATTLLELARIDDAREPAYDPGDSGGGRVEGYMPVDCGPVRSLARGELYRRGISSPG